MMIAAGRCDYDCRGAEFRALLSRSLAGSPLFEEVRGAGFMLGVKLKRLTHPWFSFEHFGWPELNDKPTIGPILCHRLCRRGRRRYERLADRHAVVELGGPFRRRLAWPA